MPSALIPYASGLASGLDDLSSPDAMPAFVNALVAPGDTIRQRPGIAAYQTSDAGVELDIIGMAVVPVLDAVVYVTSDRRIWALTAPDSDPIALSSLSTASTLLDGAARPTIAVTSRGAVIAGGGLLQKVWDLNPAQRLGGSPPSASHVAAINNRLVVNRQGNSGRLYWSGTAEGIPGAGNYEEWQTLNFTNADARPDTMTATHESIRELWAFGERTVQVYAISDDSLLPFRTVSVLNQGLSAAVYSAVQADEVFAWLDSNRRFVVSDGRSTDSLSTPAIQKTISDLATIDDGFGLRVRMDAFDCLAWVFPTEKTSFCHERNGKRWSTWRGFDATSSDGYAALGITAHCYWPERNLQLVGTSSGLIRQLSMDQATDLGEPIRIEVKTGFNNDGSDVLKGSKRTLYTIRRGVVTYGSDEEYVEIRHRDDLGTWSPWRRHGLGVEGDYDTTIYDYEGGFYRKRQRHLRYTGTAPFTMVRAESTFQAGRH